MAEQDQGRTTDKPKSKRRWYQFSLLTLLLLTTFAGIGFAWLRYKMKDAEIDKLRKEKAAVAKDWYDATNAFHLQDVVRSHYAEQYVAARALKDSRLDVATTRQERLAALREYQDQMDKIYKSINALYVVNAQGGEAESYYEAKYRFLEAQIWGMEEENWP